MNIPQTVGSPQFATFAFHYFLYHILFFFYFQWVIRDCVYWHVSMDFLSAIWPCEYVYLICVLLKLCPIVHSCRHKTQNKSSFHLVVYSFACETKQALVMVFIGYLGS